MGISQAEAGESSSPVKGTVCRGLGRGEVFSCCRKRLSVAGHGVRGDRVQEEPPGEGRSHGQEPQL